MARRRKQAPPAPLDEFVSEPQPGVRYTIPRSTLVARLFEQRWLPYKSLEEAQREASDEVLRTALLAYQNYHGLDLDGWAGPVTERSLLAPRFCALPDVMPLQQNLCKWPGKNPEIAWCLAGHPPGMDEQAVKDTFMWVFASWAKVCAIRPTFTTDQGEANVLINFGPIDRAGGTLAWSELPCGSNPRFCKQLFDSGEPWVFSAKPPRFQMDLGATGAHEVGHVLGLPHLQQGNLLQPMYQEGLREPQAGDIQEVQARYGPPSAEAPNPLPTPGKTKIIIEIDGKVLGGEVAGYRLVPLGGT
jgi:hypothetical protein